MELVAHGQRQCNLCLATERLNSDEFPNDEGGKLQLDPLQVMTGHFGDQVAGVAAK